HHGSDTSSSSDFIGAVEPTEAIYRAGEDNKYGHPDEEVVTLLDERGIELYRSDVHGSITEETDGKKASLTEYQQDKVVEPGNKKESTQKAPTDEAGSNTDTAACIDINEASEAELTGIQHIGDKRAKALIEERPVDSLDN